MMIRDKNSDNNKDTKQTDIQGAETREDTIPNPNREREQRRGLIVRSRMLIVKIVEVMVELNMVGVEAERSSEGARPSAKPAHFTEGFFGAFDGSDDGLVERVIVAVVVRMGIDGMRRRRRRGWSWGFGGRRTGGGRVDVELIIGG